MTPDSLILAIDTVLAGTSVALGSGGETKSVECGVNEAEQAERLIPAISKLMEECRVTGADIDGILVTTGPGGFTGVRMGISAGRALALGWNKPLAGISCLECLGAESKQARPHQNGPRVILRAAGGRQVTYQILAAERLFADKNMPIESETLSAVADRFGFDPALLKQPGASCVLWTESGAVWRPEIQSPGASQLVALAPELPESRWHEDVTPIYPRPPDARPRSPS